MDSTNLLEQIVEGQDGKEEQANENFAAASPAMVFSRRMESAGLTWKYTGGRVFVNGVATLVSNGTITLTASSTNYIEVSYSGAVSANTTGFSAGALPLYKATTGTSTVTSYEDHRNPAMLARVFFGVAAVAMGGSNKTLSNAQALCDVVRCTGNSASLLDLIVPAVPRTWIIHADTSGGGGIRVKTADGTGITVADGKHAIVRCDGTNVLRVTADA